ncbi:MAG: ParB/RepB/Spo0J family partition protein [Treponema sp.]|nr:ParB/RepB/Spo0J family partition protein [Treponema sp.]
MKIIRADEKDLDLFAADELRFGACCFFSEDRACKYFFVINGREATLRANSEKYISRAIDEFLFYSGFIVAIKDAAGAVLATRKPREPYPLKIADIQPSQFYLSETKLKSCKTWIKGPQDIFIPIAMREGRAISLDGHTRMRAALDLGFDFVNVYREDHDGLVFRFAEEAVRRQVNGVPDMRILNDDDYALKWHKFCDDFLAQG